MASIPIVWWKGFGEPMFLELLQPRVYSEFMVADCKSSHCQSKRHAIPMDHPYGTLPNVFQPPPRPNPSKPVGFDVH
eukprot:2347110-Amphidinium_carterae.1